MYCRTCNRDVQGNPEFCPYCGARLHKRDHNVGLRIANRSVNNTLATVILYGIMFLFSMIAFILGAKKNWVSTIMMAICTVAFVINLVFTIILLKNLDFYAKNYRFSVDTVKLVWIFGIIIAGAFDIALWIVCAVGSKAGCITCGLLEMIACAGVGVVSFLIWNDTRKQKQPKAA